MLIKILKGNYGLAVGKSVKLKTPQDTPFEVSDKEAQRLVKLGIAKIICSAVPAEEPPHNKKLTGGSVDDIEDLDEDDVYDEDEDDVPDENEDDGAEYEAEDADIPEYGEDSTNAELHAIAKEYGIEVPPHANKAQLLAALDAFFNDAPEINVKEPE